MNVLWKDVLGYEEYFSVSTNGEVYSKRTNKILKLTLSKSGYSCFVTRLEGRNGRCILLRAHRLVAEAFIPNPEGKPFVNHKNAVKTDNRVENLEWVTAQENSIHARDMGLLSPLRGEEATSAKLKEEDVIYIRENFKSRCREFGARALGRKFGVAKTTILSAARGETWSHIEYNKGH